MVSTTFNRTIDFKLPMGILDAALLPDEKSLVAACMDGVYIADLTDRSFRKIGRHDSYVRSAAVLVEKQQIVTAGYDGAIQWFDLLSEQSVRTIRIHDFWSWNMKV